jgi:eukaryotic-like serine/threonine-protein kinase
VKIVANVHYERLNQIGVGQGMNSEVYLANDPQLGGKIAVKEVPKANLGNTVADFFCEAQAMFAATHDNVLSLRWAGETADQVCMAMPHCPAGSLKSRISHNPLRIRELVRIGDGVLTGLAQVHTVGFIHFDTKPSNVLFGRLDTPLLADFGQARRIGPTGVVKIPPLYFIMMPPECMQGGVGSAQSDIYQAGALLYRCANGDPFFDAQVPQTDVEVETETLAGRFPDRDAYLPHVPLKLRQVIRRALAVNPADRYQSATEMADDLGRVASSLDWQMTNTGSTTIWCASRSPAPDYSVEVTDNGGRKDVEVYTVGGGARRAKGKSDLWAAGLKPKAAVTHLRKVFRALAG